MSFRGLRTGDLFVVVDVSDKADKPTGYDDVRMCFYIFFGLTSVVSSLSLLSKRAVKTPYELGGRAPQSLCHVDGFVVPLSLDPHSRGSRISSDTIAVAPILCLKRIQSGASLLPQQRTGAHSWHSCCKACPCRMHRALCVVRLLNENRQAMSEYYIQVKKVYFYAAVGLLEGTNPSSP